MQTWQCSTSGKPQLQFPSHGSQTFITVENIHVAAINTWERLGESPTHTLTGIFLFIT